MPATLTFGTTVTYYGSITSHHGPAILADWCDCQECIDQDLTRYALVPLTGGGQLNHVRGESFA